MEKFQLNNGMSVVFAGHSKDYSVCLSVNIGHVNEPSKGIAALFEKTLLLQVKGVIPVFGGTMTAYTTGGEDLEEALEKVAQIFNSTVISEELVEQAKAAIVKQTHDTAPLTMRRMKLLYKHHGIRCGLGGYSERISAENRIVYGGRRSGVCKHLLHGGKCRAGYCRSENSAGRYEGGCCPLLGKRSGRNQTAEI